MPPSCPQERKKESRKRLGGGGACGIVRGSGPWGHTRVSPVPRIHCAEAPAPGPSKDRASERQRNVDVEATRERGSPVLIRIFQIATSMSIAGSPSWEISCSSLSRWHRGEIWRGVQEVDMSGLLHLPKDLPKLGCAKCAGGSSLKLLEGQKERTKNERNKQRTPFSPDLPS